MRSSNASRAAGALATLALALGLGAADAGCGIIKIEVPGQKPSTFSYRGAECLAHKWDDSTKSQIVQRLCSSVGDSIMKMSERARKFDDRRADMIAVAFQTIDCSRVCKGQPLDLGMGSYYASILDPAKLRSALADVDLSSDAKDAFVDLAKMSKDDVLTKVKDLDPRRKHMYVDVPGEVVAKRKAYFEKWADLYAKLDDAEGRAKKIQKGQTAEAAPIARAIMDLRGEYLDACGAPDCRLDPFFYEATRELVMLHLVAGNDLLAAAEEDVIREPAAGRRRFGVEVGFALYQAMEEERKAADEYQHAKSAGMDEAALKAKYGDPPPIPVDPDTSYMAPELPPRLTDVGPDTAWESTSGVFRGRKDVPGKTGALGEPPVEVSFRNNVTQEDVTSCYQTNRVTGVHFDSDNHAQLEFESVCSTVGTRANVEKVPPILVPKSEAAKLEPGELVLALVDKKTREGVVLRAEAPHKTQAASKVNAKAAKITPVTQIRDHRLHPPAK